MDKKILTQATRGRKLTEMQAKFLQLYWDSDCSGVPRELAIEAGYAPNSAMLSISALKDEIIELTEMFLIQYAPKAARTIIDVIESDEPIKGVKDKLEASKTILDRVGVGKKEKIEVEHNVSGGIFLIPSKAPIDVVKEGEFVEVVED